MSEILCAKCGHDSKRHGVVWAMDELGDKCSGSQSENVCQCRLSEADVIFLAMRAAALSVLKETGKLWVMYRHDVTRYQIYAQVELLQAIGILKGPMQ